MSFTGSTKPVRDFMFIENKEIAPEQPQENHWPKAIDYAHESAWDYTILPLILSAHGVDPRDTSESNSDKLARLWENSGGKLEARECDFNGINLLDGYDGKIPAGKDPSKPAIRFSMIGLATGGAKDKRGSYRIEFTEYLQQNRIPDGLTLLIFPAQRGVHNGMFNIVLCWEKK